VSVLYTRDGDPILVSDDHSTVRLFDINTGKKLWERTVFENTPFDLFLDGISPDGNEFLTTTRVQRVNGDPSLNIHSMEVGRIIEELNARSRYLLKIGNPAFPELDADEDLRDETMIAQNARYSEDGSEIRVMWQNFKMTHGMFDLCLASYDARTHVEKWHWQIIDPRGVERRGARHFALRFLTVPGNTTEFLLFSETGEVRQLASGIIARAAAQIDIGKKPHGKLLYTLDFGAQYPQFFAETGKRGELYTALVDEDGMGNLAVMQPSTGKILWRSGSESKFTGLMLKGDGRFLITRSGKYWNIWDTATTFLTGSGPYFFQPGFRMLAVHPTKREIALCYENYLWFMIERRRKRIPVTSAWTSTGLLVNEGTEINAYGDGDIRIYVSPGARFSDGSSKYEMDGDFALHEGGPYVFDKFYFDRHFGRELFVRSEEGSHVEIWGGLTKEEFPAPLRRLRDGLPSW
jgi:hypothetical protein